MTCSMPANLGNSLIESVHQPVPSMPARHGAELHVQQGHIADHPQHVPGARVSSHSANFLGQAA